MPTMPPELVMPIYLLLTIALLAVLASTLAARREARRQWQWQRHATDEHIRLLARYAPPDYLTTPHTDLEQRLPALEIGDGEHLTGRRQ